MIKRSLQKSEMVYGLILKLYPVSYQQEFAEEMKYVFSQSLKETFIENGNQGVVKLWIRIILDAIKTITIQHLEIQKGANTMKAVNKDLLMQNKVFVGIIMITGMLLMIPWLGMQFNTSVNWSLMDFVIAGVLISGMSSLFVLMARRFRSKNQRLTIGFICAVVFLYIWVELAVGLFTNWGS